MEILFALLALCAGNSPVTGEFPSQRPVTRIFGVFFNLRLNKRWLVTPSHSLWSRQLSMLPGTLKMVVGFIISVSVSAKYQRNMDLKVTGIKPQITAWKLDWQYYQTKLQPSQQTYCIKKRNEYVEMSFLCHYSSFLISKLWKCKNTMQQMVQLKMVSRIWNQVFFANILHIWQKVAMCHSKYNCRCLHMHWYHCCRAMYNVCDDITQTIHMIRTQVCGQLWFLWQSFFSETRPKDNAIEK